MFRKKQNNASHPLNFGWITISAGILGTTCVTIQNDTAISRLFVLIQASLALIFVTTYLYKNAGILFPKSIIRKKRIHIVIASFIALIFSPATLIWHFFNIKSQIQVIKERKLLSGFKSTILDNDIQVLGLAYISITAALGFMFYVSFIQNSL